MTKTQAKKLGKRAYAYVRENIYSGRVAKKWATSGVHKTLTRVFGEAVQAPGETVAYWTVGNLYDLEAR